MKNTEEKKSKYRECWYCGEPHQGNSNFCRPICRMLGNKTEIAFPQNEVVVNKEPILYLKNPPGYL